jgi:hypothetical protein
MWIDVLQDWELVPSSSFSDWKLEKNPVSGFLTLIKNLITAHPVNQVVTVPSCAIPYYCRFAYVLVPPGPAIFRYPVSRKKLFFNSTHRYQLHWVNYCTVFASAYTMKLKYQCTIEYDYINLEK